MLLLTRLTRLRGQQRWLGTTSLCESSRFACSASIGFDLIGHSHRNAPQNRLPAQQRAFRDDGEIRTDCMGDEVRNNTKPRARSAFERRRQSVSSDGQGGKGNARLDGKPLERDDESGARFQSGGNRVSVAASSGGTWRLRVTQRISIPSLFLLPTFFPPCSTPCLSPRRSPSVRRLGLVIRMAGIRNRSFRIKKLLADKLHARTLLDSPA